MRSLFAPACKHLICMMMVMIMVMMMLMVMASTGAILHLLVVVMLVLMIMVMIVMMLMVMTAAGALLTVLMMMFVLVVMFMVMASTGTLLAMLMVVLMHMLQHLLHHILQLVRTLDGLKHRLAIKLCKRGGNDGCLLIMLTNQLHTLIDFILRYLIGSAQNNSSGIRNLIDEKLAEILNIHLALGSIHNRNGTIYLHIQFLRHIERCRVLVHMVSMSGERDPFEDFTVINAELRDFGAGLENRPQIVVATKMDEEGAEERKADFDRKTGIERIGISAITDENVSFLMKKIFEMIQKTPEFAPYSVPEEEIGGIKVYDAHLDAPKDPFEIVHPSDHLFIITGEEVTKKYALINLSTDAGVAQLISYLGRIGIDEALKEKGAKDGDTVRIQDFEFDYYE